MSDDVAGAAGEYLALEVAGARFGLPVERVREVLRVPSLTRLPFPPPSILGIVGVRGAVLPVMDLGERLLRRPADPAGRLVVVHDPAGGGDVALLVDAVPGIVEAAAVSRTPAEVEATLPAGWAVGVVEPPGGVVTLLDLASVLALTDPSPTESR